MSRSKQRGWGMLVALCLMAPLAGADPAPDFLKVEEAFQLAVTLNGAEVKADWQIADGYYLYQSRMSLTTTEAGYTLGEPGFPLPPVIKADPYFGEQAVFHHAASLVASLTPPPSGPVTVTVRYQGCADAGLCYPPQSKTLTLPPSAMQTSPVTPAATAALPRAAEVWPASPAASTEPRTDSADGLASFLHDASLPLVLATFFVLGLGLTFTPCVLPMVPILSGIIVGHHHNLSTLRAFALSSAYVLGMALTYSALGVLVGYLGAKANLQAWMQQPVVLLVFSGLFVALALAMFGFYELQLPAFLRDRLDALNRKQHGGQLLSVGVMGALSALVVSPCVSAPLAGTLLYISSTGDALLGGGALFVMALGMGLPLLIIGTTGARVLPRAGAWMDGVKQVFGVLMLAVALWLLERILPTAASLALWALLLIASAVHMGALRTGQTGWHRTAQGIGLFLLVWGVLLLIGAAQGRGSVWQPLLGLTAQAAGLESSSGVHFTRITDEAGLQAALGGDKPVLLDVYADWCISCKVMESEVFASPEVIKLQSAMNFVQLDVTVFDAPQQTMLARLELVGPPAVLFHSVQGEEVRAARLVGEVSREGFMAHLQAQGIPGRLAALQAH